MATPENTERFVQHLTEHQNRLYAYVYSLLADHSRAADVLQETNLVLWRKIDEFQADRDFLPWAFAIARYQVLAHVRDQKRDRVLLDEELVAAMGEQAERPATEFESTRDSLRHCLQSVSAPNRNLLQLRYFRSLAIADVASEVQRSVSAVKVALMRTRRQLAECVQRRMAVEG